MGMPVKFSHICISNADAVTDAGILTFEIAVLMLIASILPSCII